MTWAVVPAAGRGTRFGGDIPKQYLEVAGEPLLAHSLRALLAHPAVEGAVVVLAAEVEDLKSGEAAVEERARSELGMIKPGETFYRVVEPQPAPSDEPDKDESQ
jgi:2-C-methyl-D-erythritol 4-phosphate cytidylyltransferase